MPTNSTINTTNSTDNFMRNFILRAILGMILFLGGLGANAQITITVTGNTNTTPNLLATYSSMAVALADLNLVTAMTGPVVLTCDAGTSETAPVKGFSLGSATLNPVLSATNTITINKTGGVVTINAAVGTANGPSVTPDGMLYLNGADYVTIDGLTFTDANTLNATEAMEFGIALFKRTAGDGCNNNTIQNCTFNMQRINNNAGSAPMLDGSWAIEVLNSTASAANTALTPTNGGTLATNGTNSGNKFYGNTINNGNGGIGFGGYAATVGVGPTPTATTFLGDLGNDVGGSALATGNTILNFGGGATTSPAAGIRANLQWGINISFNTVNNNDGGGFNHATTLRGIYAQAGTSANATINNNIVTVKSAATTSACTAIDNAIGSTAAANTVSISNNTIQNSTYSTATSGTFTGILSSATAATVNISNNTINNNNIGVSTTATSCTFQGIYSSASATNFTANNNTITNNSILNQGGTLYCVRGSTSLLTWNNNIINNNGIPNNGAALAASVYGLYDGSSPTQENFADNLIDNLTISGSSTSTSSNIAGIYMTTSSSSNKIWSGNIIHTLTYSNSSTGAAAVNGMYQSLGATVNIFKNKIYDLTGNGALGTVNGIRILSGTTVNVHNNLIGNLQTPSASSTTDAVRGISSTSTTATSTINLFYNSIYLNAASSGTNFGTSGVFHTYSGTATSATLVLRNNNIVNTSTAAGTGFTVAFRRSAATSLANYSTSSNNNNFYSSGYLFYDGTNSKTTLAELKAWLAPGESASINENVTWQSTAGSSADFLKYNVGIASQLESGAANIATYTTDYAGTIRAGNGGYGGTGSAPDMGAWELEGIGADLTPPTISYTPLANSCSPGSRTLSASITDASGVPTSGIGLPVAYYSINAGAYTPVTATFVSGSTYTFSIGAGSVNGDVVAYYIVAQDNAGTPNVAAFPSAGAGGFTSNPPAASTPPTTPSSYTNLASLAAGIYGVGGPAAAGEIGHYATLTAAVADYNANCLGGNIIFALTDPSYSGAETFPIVIDANPAADATHTLTIKPETGVTSVISGSSTAALIRFNAAKYVTIDGSNNGTTSRDLTITNTGTTAPTAISLISLGTGLGATNNTIKNCNISTGVQTTLGYGIAIGGATPGTSGADNDDVTIQNNSITDCAVGIYALGTASVSTGGNDNLNITGNNIIYNGTLAAAIGIRVGNILSSSISLNGVDYETSSTSVVGISLETGTNNTSVSRNKISKSKTSHVSTLSYARGITIGTGLANAAITISNNVIYGVIATYPTTTAGGGHTGIHLGAIGTGTTYSTVNGGVDIYFNSINLTGSYDRGSAILNFGIYAGSGSSNIRVQNNIFANATNNSNASGSTSKSYSIYSAAANTAFTTINNNDYFVSGAQGVLGFLSSDRTDLSAIQAGFGQNTNSAAVNPNFTSATDLSIQPNATVTPLESGAATGTGITIDYTGVTRPYTTGHVNGGGLAPDMGAYEFDAAPLPPCTTPTAQPTSLILNATGQTTVSGSYTAASPAPTNYLVVRTTANTLAANPVNATSYAVGANAYFGTGGYVESNGSGLTISSTGLTSGTTYYYWIFSFNTGNCAGGPVYNITAPLSGNVTTGALFTSIATGNWEDATTWDQGASTPNAASDVVIAATHTVTVNASPVVGASLSIAATGTLDVTGSSLTISNTLTNNGTVNANAGMLTVTGAATTGITNSSAANFNVNGGTVNVGVTDNSFCNRRFTNSGILSVSNGSLNIYGNYTAPSASTFNQSGGTIKVDGNAAGVLANSVASGTTLINIASALGSVTGGKIIIVDPHASATATKALNYSAGSSASTNWAGHTLELGDGISTDAGGNANGIELDTYVSTGRLVLGNVIVKSGSGTNRWVSTSLSSSNGTHIGGNLTIDAGSELRDGSATIYYLSGNIINNGTLTNNLATVRLSFWNAATNTEIANTSAQTVSGTGVFRNSTTAPTALFTALTVNNSHASGVTFAAGLVPSLSGTLTVTTGRVTADGISFNGASTQTAALTAATSIINVNNVTLNNSVTFSGLGMMNISNLLAFGNVNTRTLTAAGRITLKSTAANTARIGDITNNGVNTGNVISGNVTVERFIPQRNGVANGGRAYRLLTSTVNTATSIQANWMEGGLVTTVGGSSDPNPGFGAHITGAGGNANGFDVTQTNQSSFYTATNGVTPTYTPVASTVGNMNSLTGYYLYIRGDRSVSLQVPLSTNMPTTATTLRATGTVNTGTITSFTNPFVGGGALNLVTNPYPSPIDWSLVKAASSNITDFYSFWDPNIGTRGGFVAVNSAGIPSAGTANQYIQSGQAFYVESDGAIPAVSIQETHKAAGNNNTVFIVPPAPIEAFRTGLFFIEDSGYRRQADGVMVMYGNSYNAAVDAQDAKEINNWDENIAIHRSAINLAIESRPVVTVRDTIPLFMNNMKQKTYEFEFIPTLFTNIGLKAELIDNYLNSRTTLSVVDTVRTFFTVTADPGSFATDRFMVVFGPQTPLAIDVTTIRAQAKYQPAAQGGNGVQVDWSAKTEQDMDRYELERSFNGSSFTRIHTTTAIGNSTVPVNYGWLDANPQYGLNFYRIKAIDKAGLVKYTTVVKVNFGKASPAITVYPNPVNGNSFTLQLTDLEKGSYQFVLFNSTGQAVYKGQVQHNGGSVNIPVTPGVALPAGTYQLRVTGANDVQLSKSIIKN